MTYSDEVEAIKALADAHCAILQTREVASYSVSKLLTAIEALSETLVAKAQREALPHD